jgi:N-dimethylarginine dimethylaminohydrolase
MMVAGNPATRAFYEGLGIECLPVPCDELRKAAGAVGCLTGVVRRTMVGAEGR